MRARGSPACRTSGFAAAVWLAASLVFSAGASSAAEPDPAHDPLVDASRYVPGLIVRLAYATTDNVMHRALYPADARCWLRRSAVERLALVARELAAQHLRLVAYDCTRPAAVQAALWTAYPHPGSVADPKRGSLHERGVGVDLGLVNADGGPVPLPTEFDAFGPKAGAFAALPEGPARANRDALRLAMHRHGWRVNPREWWHFSRLFGWKWPVVEPPLEPAARAAHE